MTRYAQSILLQIASLKGLQTAVGNQIDIVIIISTFQFFQY